MALPKLWAVEWLSVTSGLGHGPFQVEIDPRDPRDLHDPRTLIVSTSRNVYGQLNGSVVFECVSLRLSLSLSSPS